MTPVPPPYGAALTVAGKAGAWLRRAREEDAEVPRIIRRALRISICRYDPCAPGVDALAAELEEEMWRLSRESLPKGLKGLMGRLRAHIPKFRRQVRAEAIDIPNWREELGRWVQTAAETLPLGWRGTEAPCRSFPDPETLGERFPVMFDLELSSRRRMNPFRRKMLARLEDADRLRRGTSERLPGALGTGVGTAIAGAVGLGVAEIAQWSDPVLVGTAFATAGLAARAVVLARGRKRTDRQKEVRALVYYWITDHLRRLTDAPPDEDPYLMLQEVIENESRARHSDSAGSERFEIDRDLSKELREQLTQKLIPAAEAAGEGHLCEAMDGLAKALVRRGEEPCPDDAALHALHLTLVALELAPARAT